MIYELRTYTTESYSKQAVVVEVMEKLMPVFEKAGIKVIGLWTTFIGLNGEFVYLLEYESMTDYDKKWASLLGDPDLYRLMAAGAAEWSTLSERNVFLKPTSYSPIR